MASYLQRECNKELLAQLPEPKEVWAFFLMLTEIPRMSSHLDALRQHLLQLAESWEGCQGFTDEIGNVLIRKKAAKGWEEVPSVAIQCHMDMVCSANEGTVFDFLKDPINCEISGEWLKAKGTTLGSDNGMGLAACLAILANPDALHGPLECLFTVDEETTMAGAEFLAPAPFMQSKILINVDSEEEEAICIGCAGGFEVHITIPVERTTTPETLTRLSVALKGLVGGHTGIDIHKGRANAIKVLSRMLAHTMEEDVPGLRLCSLEGGGAVNTIPRECFAQVALPEDKVSLFKEKMEQLLAVVKQEHISIEENIILLIEPVTQQQQDEQPPLDAASTQKVFDFIASMLHGALRNVPFDQKEVETSISCSVVKLSQDHLFIHPFARSSSDSQLHDVRKRLQGLVRLAGGRISEMLNYAPGWNPDMESKALVVVKEACEKVFGKEPRIYSVHAGLECGFVKGRYPDMDCVSIGPDIRDAHTPDEKCCIPSVKRFFDLLLLSLQGFKQN
ncbi:Aminoacyl-histidine dipeptidase [Balamuthia mandrillaris]